MILLMIRAVVIYPIKVAFERIYVSIPEAAELGQPGIDLLKSFRFQTVEAALCVHRGFHETGVAQHAQMLGHGRLRHTKLTLNLSHRLLRRDQEAQDGPPVRLRNNFEGGFHALYILHMVYTCKGIFKKKRGRGCATSRAFREVASAVATGGWDPFITNDDAGRPPFAACHRKPC